MCGIAGFWKFNKRDSGEELIMRPQPMESFNGRYLIVFNGEIYNSKDIREKLEKEGIKFKDNSEAEVALNSFLIWGIRDALKMLNGVFAFAMWDKQENKLYLARDRIGVKPLYYGIQSTTLFFASELTDIAANKLFKPEIDRDVLALFFRHNYIPAPYSIYKKICKLEAGYYAVIDSNQNIKLNCYWDLRKLVEEGIKNPIDLSEEDATRELEKLLLDSIAKRMLEGNTQAAVFLSGGIDSSLTVALMQTQSNIPIKTFSIGLNDKEYNEAIHAKRIAHHLGTEHTELYITSDDALQVIPKLPDIYDEPFADSSQIPTLLVSQLARKYVTAILSGDGGDELFAGYNRYYWANSIWNTTKILPSFVKSSVTGLLKGISPQRWDKLFNRFGFLFPDAFKQRFPGDRLHKLVDLLESSYLEDIYLMLISHWKKPTDIVLSSREPKTVLHGDGIKDNIPNFIDRMMFFDLMTYLPDDGLVKVNKASTAARLKARTPMLDYRVVEFSKRLPLSFKIKNKKSKWILRKILYKYVPQKFIERPKMGFGVPMGDWLRGPLRDWAEELLNKQNLENDGFLNPEPIHRLWREHLSGSRNWQYHLWDVLMFQAWKARWM